MINPETGEVLYDVIKINKRDGKEQILFPRNSFYVCELLIDIELLFEENDDISFIIKPSQDDYEEGVGLKDNEVY